METALDTAFDAALLIVERNLFSIFSILLSWVAPSKAIWNYGKLASYLKKINIVCVYPDSYK